MEIVPLQLNLKMQKYEYKINKLYKNEIKSKKKIIEMRGDMEKSIVFNPKKLFLRGVEKVELSLKEKDRKSIHLMKKEDNGTFIFKLEDLNYMNYYFLANDKKIYPHKLEICIVSTMSSGKSTFINALLGKEILPSENEACTGKIFKINKILSNQEETIVFKEKEEIKRYYLNEEYLKYLNKDEISTVIEIASKFYNVEENITLIDTPGVNNSRNIEHRNITYNFLKNNRIKNLIYILNATQLGVNDDRNFLLDIKELPNNESLNIIFILNKIDEIDSEKESLEEILENAKSYLSKNGFLEAQIYPITAYNCKLLRYALNNNLKTRGEISKVISYYDGSEVEELGDEMIKIGPRYLCKNKLEKLIEQTGVPEVESAIQNINIFEPTFVTKIERSR